MDPRLARFCSEHALPLLHAIRFTVDGDEETVARAEPARAHRFPFASVTKTFTAALCLEPEFRPLLDTPLRNTLPWFRLRDPVAGRDMTPRDALCHFSGLPPHTDAWVRSTESRRAFLEHRLPELAPAGPFRERHRYSNLMYAVLGQWMEERGGVPWEDRLKNRILDPLGLSSIRPLDETWTASCPPPHELRNRRLVRIPPFFARAGHVIAPASELTGSVDDLAAWGRHQLSLRPDDARWRPHALVTTDRPFPEFGPLHYGLGWRIDTVNGERRVWHSGQCSGYTALLTLYPERGRGLAALTNRGGAVEALHALDLRIFHGNQIS